MQKILEQNKQRLQRELTKQVKDKLSCLSEQEKELSAAFASLKCLEHSLQLKLQNATESDEEMTMHQQMFDQAKI